MTGDKRGVYAIGKIVSDIKRGKESEKEHQYSKSVENEERDYVEVGILHKFLDDPIPSEQIKENDILSSANFGTQGTNLKLTKKQYKEILKIKDIEDENIIIEKGDEMSKKFHKNTIFYGPPGTGKTYNVVNRALKIIDGVALLSENGAKSVLVPVANTPEMPNIPQSLLTKTDLMSHPDTNKLLQKTIIGE